MSSKSLYLLKLLFLFITLYEIYARVKPNEALDQILNINRRMENGQITPLKIMENMERNKKINIQKKNSKQKSKEIKGTKKLNEQKRKKEIELKTKELISKEIKKQKKKEEKKKEIKEEMAAIEAVVIKNLTKDLEKVKKEVKKTRKEIEKEIEENEKENKKVKKPKFNKNIKNKEIEDSDEEEEEEEECIIPTFGEHSGFMGIVMHKLIKPNETKNINKSKVKASKEKNKYLISQLNEKKDVHNLLWTAVAVAQEKLLKEKDKGIQTCLLEFIARMVGGAYSPFASIKEDTHHHHHITSFVYKLKKNDIAFLSSGYRKFWREKIGEEKFKELEKKVKPVFINKEY